MEKFICRCEDWNVLHNCKESDIAFQELYNYLKSIDCQTGGIYHINVRLLSDSGFDKVEILTFVYGYKGFYGLFTNVLDLIGKVGVLKSKGVFIVEVCEDGEDNDDE